MVGNNDIKEAFENKHVSLFYSSSLCSELELYKFAIVVQLSSLLLRKPPDRTCSQPTSGTFILSNALYVPGPSLHLRSFDFVGKSSSRPTAFFPWHLTMAGEVFRESVWRKRRSTCWEREPTYCRTGPRTKSIARHSLDAQHFLLLWQPMSETEF